MVWARYGAYELIQEQMGVERLTGTLILTGVILTSRKRLRLAILNLQVQLSSPGEIETPMKPAGPIETQTLNQETMEKEGHAEDAQC